MTGKDIILFIINNNLINEEFGMDDRDDGAFMTTEEASVKLGISISSLLDMVKLGIIDSLDVNGQKYFYKNIDLTSLRKERV